MINFFSSYNKEHISDYFKKFRSAHCTIPKILQLAFR